MKIKQSLEKILQLIRIYYLQIIKKLFLDHIPMKNTNQGFCICRKDYKLITETSSMAYH